MTEKISGNKHHVFDNAIYLLTMNWSRWRRARQVVQILTFALYVYLLFAALQRRAAFSLADLFFRLNPLAALSAMLADRVWIPRLALALVTLLLTLILGRVWCGWLCPLGTLLEWVHFRSTETKDFPETRFLRWRTVKNWLLLLILAAALFGNLSLLVFDPLALFTRTMTTVVIPALNYAITAVERAAYPISFLRPIVNWTERLLRGPVLPVIQPVFAQNAVLALLFLGTLALNALADRFWCRYLCPLGALLGLLSKISFLRPFVRPACNRCGHCVTACRLDAIDSSKDYEIVTPECTVCLDCLAACPESGIGFRLDRRPDPIREHDPTRRQALAALAAGTAGVVVLRTSVQTKQPHTQLIRPPGVDDEVEFMARCLRCSQCMKVCPTSGLQPAFLEAGLEGLWTPRLASRLGYCDYGCNACGQICPSGAIPPLDLTQKREVIIGVAVIDRNRCLPWAQGIPCIVCEEMCPTPEKAIRLEQVTVDNDQGEPIIVQQPYVLQDMCIGCGICEYQCPVEGESAIVVYRA
ncbi:MAG: 4Fe-4S binding protein [Chloroflexi bacterium]|nr:4Fe-4S binding protein [Chloroflexota bacterium]